MRPVEQLIAEALGVHAEAVTDSLEFQSIPEWDSLNHVNLMLALEREFDLEIDAESIVSLTSVQSIRRFIDARLKGGGR